MNGQDFEKACKLVADVRTELERLSVASGDSHGSDETIAAGQLQRAVDLGVKLEAATHLAMTGYWFAARQQGQG